jgi:hypothetical protein
VANITIETSLLKAIMIGWKKNRNSVIFIGIIFVIVMSICNHVLIFCMKEIAEEAEKWLRRL